MNSVRLIGRLTANPVSHAGEKHESATFRLAVPRPGSDTADFIDIVTFDGLAATPERPRSGADRKVAVRPAGGGYRRTAG